MPKSVPGLCTPTVGAERYFALMVQQLPGMLQTQRCPDVGTRHLSSWQPYCCNLPCSKVNGLDSHCLYSK